MLLLVILLAVASLCDVTSSSKADHAYVIGLLQEPVYDSVEAESKLPNTSIGEQSMRVTIRNPGDISENVGFHAYLPDSAEITSFSMHSAGVSYKGKRMNRQVAEEIMTKANVEDHNAVVYIPKPLLDSFVGELQTAGNTVHIKSRHEMTFDLTYSANILETAANDEKVRNRAGILLDLYGNRVEDLTAEISSPNHPNNYPNNADITWWIHVPEGKTVSLQIDDLDIEECCDRLVVYDGASHHNDIIAELTGNYDELMARQFQSSSNSMSLRLASDCSKTSGGFRASTSTAATPRPPPVTETVPVFPTSSPGNNTAIYVCTGVDDSYVYPNTYLNLSSPGYPTSYYNNLNCAWRIQAYYNYNVHLTVVDMQLERDFDYVNVYDGSSAYYPLLRTLTSNDTADLYSTGTYMYITFITDSSVTYKGFSMIYTASFGPATTATNYPETTTDSGPIYCSDHIELYSGSSYITSPNYPSNYGSNTQCSWYIHGHYTDYIVGLYVDYLSLGIGDFVTVYDGYFYESLKNFTYGENYLYQYVYSKSESMSISFTSDDYSEGPGFRFRYYAVYRPQTTEPSVETTSTSFCSGTTQLSAHTHVHSLTSLGYPYGYYDNMDCSWRIYSSYYNYVVQLTIDDMELESCCDYLEIYDGYSSSYDKIVRLTGVYNSSSDLTYHSTGSYMYLNFKTDHSVTEKGFSLTYIAVNAPTSGYPGEETTIGTLPFFDESTASSICSTVSSFTAYTYYNSFTSPGYPYGYYNNMDCSWRIYSPYYNYVVQLTVVHMELASCCDYLDIYDGYSSSYDEIVRLTGVYNSATDQMYHSTGTYMYLNFKTDQSSTRKGFELRYTAVYLENLTPDYSTERATISSNTAQRTEVETTSLFSVITSGASSVVDGDGCETVHYIYYSTGYLSSPNYPSNYLNDLNECWYFPYNGNGNQHYHFRVESFSTELNRDILYITSTVSGVYREISGTVSYGTEYYSSHDNGLYLRFLTDYSNTYQGFNLYYYLTS